MTYRMGAVFKTPHTIRLAQDYERMKQLRNDSTILDFKAEGDPPDKYIITFHGKSLVPIEGGGVKVGKKQEVEIFMGADYPRTQPRVHWLTPILHSNISGGNVCLGNYGNAWSPYYKLTDLVEILWDYSRLKILNYEGGYNRDIDWDALRREYQFPIDHRPLRDKVLAPDEGSSIIAPEAGGFDIVIMPDDEGCH